MAPPWRSAWPAPPATVTLPFKGIIATATQMLAAPLRSGPGAHNHNHNQPQQGGPPVCYLGIHGDADGLIPYAGGPLFTNREHFSLLSNDASNQRWADHNGCAAAPPTTADSTLQGTAVTHSVWDCPAAARVEHYRVHGGGHTGADRELWGKIVGFVAACESEQGAAAATEASAAPSTPDTAASAPTPPATTAGDPGNGDDEGAASSQATAGTEAGTTAAPGSSGGTPAATCSAALAAARSKIAELQEVASALRAKLAAVARCGGQRRGRRATAGAGALP